MTRIVPLPFQERHVEVLVERFRALKRDYDRLVHAGANDQLSRMRKDGACVLLQAPTGIGKTLIAAEMMARFSAEESLIWLWFAPFTGILGQARGALRRQAPSLTQLELDTDRQVTKLESGATFVLSWQTVAARSAESRLARQSGDAGLSIDELLTEAKAEGFRIGLIIDEAHHGFIRATQAVNFFRDVLAPDYVLMMTATPGDPDAAKFSQQTAYRIGPPDEWASISRQEGVDAQLLKPSVKVARFIAQNQNDAQLVAFEEVAMAECAAMHRQIERTLSEASINLTPLMLVQVPNGAEAQRAAQAFLINNLRFPASAVRIHTADEPDGNIAALADDPSVQVLIFKMAVAIGFDAPRAFTLAALRGNRSADFGTQVVGRILRVHKLLQGRLDSLPSVLRHGYVFLANSEAQEGLLAAAHRLNDMPSQLSAASPSTVITIIADHPEVQILSRGENLTLLPQATSNPQEPHLESANAADFAEAQNERALGVRASASGPRGQAQGQLFQDLVNFPGGAAHSLARGYAEQTPLSTALALDGGSASIIYPLKPGMPEIFTTERLPAVPEDFEQRLVANINFRSVVGDRLKVRTHLVERSTELFESATPEDRDVWAHVSAAAIAERARQIAFAFDDVDRRLFLMQLKKRFREALLAEGHEVPESEEELTSQLELILVRNDSLIKNAYRRVRAEQIEVVTVHLPRGIESPIPLAAARKNIYGVFPADLNIPEKELAELLDTSAGVIWWHRNPLKRPESVALYQWSHGIGFFPDFIVRLTNRTEGGGIVLIEHKGPQLQQYDKEKAGAHHCEYGRVFMVGRRGTEEGFHFYRLTERKDLVEDGAFDVDRLRFS